MASSYVVQDERDALGIFNALGCIDYLGNKWHEFESYLSSIKQTRLTLLD